MDEIHAFKNADGTYRIELHCKIICNYKKKRIKFEDTIESIINIPRAKINVCVLNDVNKNEHLTFELGTKEGE